MTTMELLSLLEDIMAVVKEYSNGLIEGHEGMDKIYHLCLAKEKELERRIGSVEK